MKKNYFLQISFSWDEVFRLFDLVQEGAVLEVGEEYGLASSNSNSQEPLINKNGAIFEYYIIPESRHVFCAIKKWFFESPNIIYPEVLKSSAQSVRAGVSCGFVGSRLHNDKPGFWISYSGATISKALVVLFDKKYLDAGDVMKHYGNQIPLEAYTIERNLQLPLSARSGDSTKVNPANITEDLFVVQVGPQSIQDAQMSPFTMELHSYSKNARR